MSFNRYVQLFSPKRLKIRFFINDRYWDQWQCAFMHLLTSKSARGKGPRQDFWFQIPFYTVPSPLIRSMSLNR